MPGQREIAGRGSQVLSVESETPKMLLGSWLAAPSLSQKLHLPVLTWDSSNTFQFEFVKKIMLVDTEPLKVASVHGAACMGGMHLAVATQCETNMSLNLRSFFFFLNW